MLTFFLLHGVNTSEVFAYIVCRYVAIASFLTALNAIFCADDLALHVSIYVPFTLPTPTRQNCRVSSRMSGSTV